MKETIVSLTIRYINGVEQHFEFIPQVGVGGQVNLASRIERSFTTDPLVLELEDRVLFIPLANVQNIEISPIPAKLPEASILNVRKVKSDQPSI